eukprot:1964080-Alexandrium_andersonii.AAC.1
MSASLVGSEMCIRDRSFSLIRARRSSASRPPGRPPTLPPSLLTGRSPVSYTHLTLPTICSV